MASGPRPLLHHDLDIVTEQDHESDEAKYYAFFRGRPPSRPFT
jgi:hypothetical protein